MVADVLNSINIKRRPFEVVPGSTDRICTEAREIIKTNMKNGKFLKGLWLARKKLKTIQVDRSKKRPIVHVMGEFWAKTTDGDGNYSLFRYIEGEGGVISNETITDWLIHQVWRARWTLAQKRESKIPGLGEFKLKAVELITGWLCKSVGVLLGEKMHISNNTELAHSIKDHFDLHIDGGEDHMEVAHHIHIAKNRLADLIISVKPFTCLSSSGVSDGVQSKISELFPQVEFIAVETNGDSAANFYSRIQMALQKVYQKTAATA
jgi:predicted nucleotide-binding protein (sugar kinase/HSP70/actin superfamily)